MMETGDTNQAQQEIFMVQDRLFRVWGKLVLEKEDACSYYGKFVPMPDFQYLKSRFEEHEQLLASDFQNLEKIGELTNWIVELRPRLISNVGNELPLLSAEIRTLERPGSLVLYGAKLSEDE